jgi:hypothetical protein
MNAAQCLNWRFIRQWNKCRPTCWNSHHLTIQQKILSAKGRYRKLHLSGPYRLQSSEYMRVQTWHGKIKKVVRNRKTFVVLSICCVFGKQCHLGSLLWGWRSFQFGSPEMPSSGTLRTVMYSRFFPAYIGMIWAKKRFRGQIYYKIYSSSIIDPCTHIVCMCRVYIDNQLHLRETMNP